MAQEPEVRLKHPYFMYDAIQHQPQAMEEMLRKHATRAQEVAAEIAGKRRLYLVGIGTSWHGALVAQHWPRRFAGRSVEVLAWDSFEFCSYPTWPPSPANCRQFPSSGALWSICCLCSSSHTTWRWPGAPIPTCSN